MTNFSTLKANVPSNHVCYFYKNACWLDGQSPYHICGYFSRCEITIMHQMSWRQLSNDECRNRVCVFCWERSNRSINRSEISILKQHVFPAYDRDIVRFQNGICTTCSRNVYRRRQWDFTWKFLPSAKLTECTNKAQRNRTFCGCLICETVQLPPSQR